MTADARSWTERGEAVLAGNYGARAHALVRGEGCLLFDEGGREYLDMMGGIATAVLGHCHPRVRAALEAQSGRLWHSSNLFHTLPQIELAERLCEHSFAERVFFANSGAEANEAAFKLARRYYRERGEDRFEFVVFDRAFHGRTLFTLSATANPAFQRGFEPLVSGFHQATFGDLESTARLVGEHTAAIVVEPVQGEGGVRPADPEFLAGLRELADRRGCLLIFDEIQSGMGRTGELFAYQHYRVTPDVMTLAKALANGLPIGAMLTRDAIARALAPGSHGSTFGGNPIAAACATAVVDELVGGALERAAPRAARLARGLADVARRAGERVVEVRGLGFLWGLQVAGEAAKVIDRAREAGALFIPAGPDVVRLAPPLVVSDEQIDRALEVIEAALRAL